MLIFCMAYLAWVAVALAYTDCLPLSIWPCQLGLATDAGRSGHAFGQTVGRALTCLRVSTGPVEQLSWFLAPLMAFYQRASARFSNRWRNRLGTERDSSVGRMEWVNATMGIVWVDASTHSEPSTET